MFKFILFPLSLATTILLCLDEAGIGLPKEDNWLEKAVVGWVSAFEAARSATETQVKRDTLKGIFKHFPLKVPEICGIDCLNGADISRLCNAVLVCFSNVFSRLSHPSKGCMKVANIAEHPWDFVYALCFGKPWSEILPKSGCWLPKKHFKLYSKARHIDECKWKTWSLWFADSEIPLQYEEGLTDNTQNGRAIRYTTACHHPVLCEVAQSKAEKKDLVKRTGVSHICVRLSHLQMGSIKHNKFHEISLQMCLRQHSSAEQMVPHERVRYLKSALEGKELDEKQRKRVQSLKEHKFEFKINS